MITALPYTPKYRVLLWCAITTELYVPSIVLFVFFFNINQTNLWTVSCSSALHEIAFVELSIDTTCTVSSVNLQFIENVSWNEPSLSQIIKETALSKNTKSLFGSKQNALVNLLSEHWIYKLLLRLLIGIWAPWYNFSTDVVLWLIVLFDVLCWYLQKPHRPLSPTGHHIIASLSFPFLKQIPQLTPEET